MFVQRSVSEYLQVHRQRSDSESGLDNFDFRYYASTMGRFMKPDDPFNWNSSNPHKLEPTGTLATTH